MTKMLKINAIMEEIMLDADKKCKTEDEHILRATSMLYCARMILETYYGKETAVNLIDTLGGKEIEWQKPTIH